MTIIKNIISYFQNTIYKIIYDYINIIKIKKIYAIFGLITELNTCRY